MKKNKDSLPVDLDEQIRQWAMDDMFRRMGSFKIEVFRDSPGVLKIETDGKTDVLFDGLSGFLRALASSLKTHWDVGRNRGATSLFADNPDVFVSHIMNLFQSILEKEFEEKETFKGSSPKT